MNIKTIIYRNSIADLDKDQLSMEAWEFVHNNEEAMEELTEYIEDKLGETDLDGVVSVDIDEIEDFLVRSVDSDEGAQEILRKYKKKFELRKDDTMVFEGTTLYRIVALIPLKGVPKGELGGYVESEANLSQFDDSWISYGSIVMGKAFVGDNAKVTGKSLMKDSAMALGRARIQYAARLSDFAVVRDNAKVLGTVKDHAIVQDNAIIDDFATVGGNTLIKGETIIASGINIK